MIIVFAALAVLDDCLSLPLFTWGADFSHFPDVYGQLWKGNGAQGRDRTTDTAIFSRMLYQLSYLGIAAWPREGRAYRRG
jgi:hypothetical protein